MIRLEDWHYDKERKLLTGYVFNHSQFSDGTYLELPGIVSFDEPGRLARTAQQNIHLGKSYAENWQEVGTWPL